MVPDPSLCLMGRSVDIAVNCAQRLVQISRILALLSRSLGRNAIYGLVLQQQDLC